MEHKGISCDNVNADLLNLRVFHLLNASYEVEQMAWRGGEVGVLANTKPHLSVYVYNESGQMAHFRSDTRSRRRDVNAQNSVRGCKPPGVSELVQGGY